MTIICLNFINQMWLIQYRRQIDHDSFNKGKSKVTCFLVANVNVVMSMFTFFCLKRKVSSWISTVLQTWDVLPTSFPWTWRQSEAEHSFHSQHPFLTRILKPSVVTKEVSREEHYIRRLRNHLWSNIRIQVRQTAYLKKIKKWLMSQLWHPIQISSPSFSVVLEWTTWSSSLLTGCSSKTRLDWRGSRTSWVSQLGIVYLEMSEVVSINDPTTVREISARF